jgi:PAS domain S-box-containing protein
MINSAPILSVVHQLSLDLSNSKDSNEIYTTYCRAVLDLLPADRFAVALLDPDAQLRIVFSRNSQKDFEVGQAEMELCKRVVASGNSVHVSVDDLAAWIDMKEVDLSDVSFAWWLGIPLRASAAAFGVVAVRSDRKDNPFRETHIAFLESVGNQLSFLISRMREEEALREAVKYQSAAAVLAQSALSETDIAGFLNEAVILLSRVLGMEFCEILELHPNSKEFFRRAGVGWMNSSSTFSMVPATVQSLPGSALFSDIPLIIEDLRSEPKFTGSPSVYEHGVISGICMKIHRKGEILGVLCVFSAEQRSFSKASIYFLETTANILATFLQESRFKKTIRASHERMRLVIESQSLVIWDWDLLTREMYWSEAIENVFGYKKEEVESDPEFKEGKIHPDDRDRIVESLEACIEKGEKKWSAIYQFMHADGSFSGIYDSGSIIYNEKGRAIRMVGGMKEIIENKGKGRHP